MKIEHLLYAMALCLFGTFSLTGCLSVFDEEVCEVIVQDADGNPLEGVVVITDLRLVKDSTANPSERVCMVTNDEGHAYGLGYRNQSEGTASITWIEKPGYTGLWRSRICGGEVQEIVLDVCDEEGV
jgi:hypothetical protein